MWYVYIVRCNDSSLYTGVTNNISERICEHNAGKGAKYTQRRKPVKLLYTESFENRSKAQVREHEIKSFSRANKLKLI
ncbi:MAG: GIY-YIG nuclease family protein, partial [Candidatus Omnitrophica bacterium]|nr:GIY-YIG nuclease family protein [Candidatus Omnitrophota bacterium]